MTYPGWSRESTSGDWNIMLCYKVGKCSEDDSYMSMGHRGQIVVVQSLSHARVFAAPWTAACQATLSFTISLSLLNLMSMTSRWCHPNHFIPFSSYLQSFKASGFFPMNQLFASRGQSIAASPSASVLPMTIEGWFPLGVIGSISLLSKGLSRAFSSATIWKHQFFSAQASLWSNSHSHTWLLEKP